jgi:DNA-binding transcriptional LysR family regulator
MERSITESISVPSNASLRKVRRLDIADGRLVRVLEEWCPPFAGYHFYHPRRRQPSVAFSLLVDALRYQG